MLEAVHGLGVLLQRGWRPARTIVVASWDAEEEGMIGSTDGSSNIQLSSRPPSPTSTSMSASQEQPSTPLPHHPCAISSARSRPKCHQPPEAPSPSKPSNRKHAPMADPPGRTSPTATISPSATLAPAPTTLLFYSTPASLHRHRLRRPLQRLSQRLRQLRLVRALRRSHLRIHAAAGPLLRLGNPAHG